MVMYIDLKSVPLFGPPCIVIITIVLIMFARLDNIRHTCLF